MSFISGKRASICVFVVVLAGGCGPLPNAKSPAPPPHAEPAPSAVPTPSEPVPVRLHSRVNEVGTLELSCQSTRDRRSWKLEYSVREVSGE